MKNLKRILSILLTVCIFFSMQVFALEFSDVATDNKNAEAIDVLSSLGIIKGYEDGTFKPDKEVTRAEITSLLMRLLNMSITGTTVADSGYTDVANNHWAVYDIKTASGLGIIKGYGDGNFGPEASVTFEQAVKMVVAMLGYESEAINKGGWPDGYVSQGRDLGLLKNAEMAQTEPAPRKIIAQILYNALEVDLMGEVTTSDKENKSYYIKKGQNVMTDYIKISKVTGMVTANSTTRLDNNASQLTAKQIEITVNGVANKYVVGNFENAKDMLGMSVVAYVKDDPNEFNPVIQHIMNKSKVETIELKAAEIETFAKTNISTIDESTGKIKNYTIKDDAVFMYNGKAIDKDDLFDRSKVDIRNSLTVGSVKLTDSGSGYDFIEVESYNTYVVKSVDTSTNIIYFDTSYMNNPASTEIYVPVDNSYGYNIKITKNGADFKLSSIRKGNLVSIKQNLSSYQSGIQNIEILVSDVKTTGKITEKSEEGVVVGSKQYKISDSLSGTALEGKIAYNANGTYYIDAFGEIAYAEFAAGGTYKYGYVIKAGKKSDGIANIRVFDYTSNSVQLYDFHTRVELNGLSKTEHDDIITAIDNGATKFKNNDPSNTQGQPIKYMLNGQGKISELITVDYATDESIYVKDNSAIYSANSTYNTTNKYFKVGTTNYTVDSKTIILEIPSNKAELDGYAKRTNTYFKNEYPYEIHVIGKTETGSAGIILAYEANVDKDVNYNSPTYIVKEIKDVYENEENKTRLTLINFQNGTESTAYCMNKSYIANVGVGDVIRYGKDKHDYINDKVYVYMDYSAVKAGTLPNSSTSKNDYSVNTNYPFVKVVSSANYNDPYRIKNLNDINDYYVHLLAMPYGINENVITITDSIDATEIAAWAADENGVKAPAAANTALLNVTSSTYFHTINDNNEIKTVKGSTDENNVLGTITTYKDTSGSKYDLVYMYIYDESLKAVYIIK